MASRSPTVYEAPARERVGRSWLVWAGISLLAVVGVIHLVTAPDQFDDATYKGLLFLVNVAGCAVAAAGLWRGERWAWPLGLLMAAGALVAYVVSRTVGLPGLSVDPDVFEPLGVISVLAEAGFIAVAIQAYRRGGTGSQ